jgi:hypothetical protein
MATLTELVEQAYPKQEVSPGTPLVLPEDSKQFPRPPVADFIKNWTPYVNPEAATPGIVGETVGKQGAFPQTAPSPVVPSPTAKPAAKEKAPVPIPEGIPTEGADKEGGSTTLPPLESTVTDKTWTDYGKAGAKLTAIEGEKVKLAADVANLKDRMTNDKGSLQEYTKLMASQLRLEDALDPESDGFKTFAKNISDTAQKMQAARADLEDYQKKAKADPNRYWRETPALEHVFNGIAMLMEGNVAAAATRAGMSMPTGMVQQRIDRAIQDDLNRQKEEFKSGEAARENTINRFRDNMKILGDERAAALKTEIEFMSQAKNRIDLIAKDPKYQNEADKLLAREASLKLDEQAVLKEAEMNKVLMKKQTESKPLVGKALSPEDIRKDNELNVMTLGIPNRVRSLDSAKEIREISGATETGVAAVRAMKQIREKMTMGLIPLSTGFSELRTLGDAIKRRIILSVKKTENLGTLDEGMVNFSDSMVPGSAEWGQTQTKLDALEKGFLLNYTSALNQHIDGKQYDPQGVTDRFDALDKERGLTKYWLSGLKE